MPPLRSGWSNRARGWPGGAYPLRVVDPSDERQYAWKMIRAARRAHTSGRGAPSASHEEVVALLEQAMEAGLDRGELIMALSNLGGRLLTVCNPVDVAEDACLT